MLKLIAIATALVCAACGTVNDKPTTDATPQPDAPPVAPAPPAGQELATAAGRMTGGSWTVDVNLGSVASQSTSSGGSWTVRGGSPLNP